MLPHFVTEFDPLISSNLRINAIKEMLNITADKKAKEVPVEPVIFKGDVE